MSPAIAPVSPSVFRAIIEKAGFRLAKETEYNWTLFKEDATCPIITIPKKGKLISVQIMMGVLDKIKMDLQTYFNFLNGIRN